MKNLKRKKDKEKIIRLFFNAHQNRTTMDQYFIVYNHTRRERVYTGGTYFSEEAWERFVLSLGWSLTDKMENRGDHGDVIRHNFDGEKAADVDDNGYERWTDLSRNNDDMGTQIQAFSRYIVTKYNLGVSAQRLWADFTARSEREDIDNVDEFAIIKMPQENDNNKDKKKEAVPVMPSTPIIISAILDAYAKIFPHKIRTEPELRVYEHASACLQTAVEKMQSKNDADSVPELRKHYEAEIDRCVDGITGNPIGILIAPPDWRGLVSYWFQYAARQATDNLSKPVVKNLTPVQEQFLSILRANPQYIDDLLEIGAYKAKKHWCRDCPHGFKQCDDCHSGDTEEEMTDQTQSVLKKLWSKTTDGQIVNLSDDDDEAEKDESDDEEKQNKERQNKNDADGLEDAEDDENAYRKSRKAHDEEVLETRLAIEAGEYDYGQ